MPETQTKMDFGTCDDCGCELTEDNQHELDGRTLCEDCYEQYYHCEECGITIHRM